MSTNFLIRLEYERKHEKYFPKRAKQKGMVMAESSQALKRSNAFTSSSFKYQMLSIKQQEREMRASHNKNIIEIERLKKSLEKPVSPNLTEETLKRKYMYKKS